jgi:hypothetical protein
MMYSELPMYKTLRIVFHQFHHGGTQKRSKYRVQKTRA